jgi:hypothetical protein
MAAQWKKTNILIGFISLINKWCRFSHKEMNVVDLVNISRRKISNPINEFLWRLISSINILAKLEVTE